MSWKSEVVNKSGVPAVLESLSGYSLILIFRVAVLLFHQHHISTHVNPMNRTSRISHNASSECNKFFFHAKTKY